MIHPRNKWAIQLLGTNVCQRACSNCTQCVSHAEHSFFVSTSLFAKTVECVKSFLIRSPPTDQPEGKLLILMGGEITFHPEFPALCDILRAAIPDKMRLGLWTGVQWQQGRHTDKISETFGGFNVNLHDRKCLHTPILVAIQDVVKDKAAMWAAIDRCWLDKRWASAASINGFWFCEVACALDMVMHGPGGLLIEPDVWNRSTEDFEYQRQWACPRCGIALNLKGRRDTEEIDDISPTNLRTLRDRPRVKTGHYRLYDEISHETVEKPWEYLK